MSFEFKELIALDQQCSTPATCQTTQDVPTNPCEPKKRHPGYLAAFEAVRLELRAELATEP